MSQGTKTNSQRDRLIEILNLPLWTSRRKGRRGMQTCNKCKAYVIKFDLNALQSIDVACLAPMVHKLRLWR